MTTSAIVSFIFGLSIGMIAGLFLAGRHVELECETAYLSGHVDGYGKAVADGGEVGL